MNTDMFALLRYLPAALAIALLAMGISSAEAKPAAAIKAQFTDGNRAIEISTPGIEAFHAGFSATVEISGTRKVLNSADGVPVKEFQNESEKTPYGAAKISVASVKFEKEQITLDLRIGQIPGVPGVLLQAVLHNNSNQPVNLISLAAVDMDSAQNRGLKLDGEASQWIVTTLDRSAWYGFLASPLSDLGDGKPIHEYGSIYRKDGVGFLLGPVGEPIAYLENRVALRADGLASLLISSDMSGVRVDPGETRAGQQAVLLMEQPQTALTRWTDWVAKTHHARTDKGALAGWCSWYHLTNNIKGSDVLGVVDAVKANLARLRPQVVQIDDGYQDIDGMWDANSKFPEGMAYYAKRISEVGARPGLWMAMTIIGVKSPWLKDWANMEAVWDKKFKVESSFRPDASGWIDPTHPRAIEHIKDRVRHAVQNGYTYIKLDFNNIGTGGWYEKKKTSFEIMREHFTRIREAAGESTYILHCDAQPNRATVGLVDATRTSQDAHRGGVRAAVNDVLRSYQLNGRWMAVDNDCYYIDPEQDSVGRVEGGWKLQHTWLSMMGLSCGAAITSDPWHWDVLKPNLRNVEIMQPPAKEHTAVLDLCKDTEWPRLAGVVKRPWGSWGVALLWNPKDTSQAVTLNFADAGLDPAKTYAVWSFWDNKFLGLAKGSWTTPALEGWACQHLTLTPIDEKADTPTIIGSNLHIYCGAAELKKVSPSKTNISIELTDAGARDGDIFIYSAKPLTISKAVGLTAKGIEQAGDKVWAVHITDRQIGQVQSVKLSVGK